MENTADQQDIAKGKTNAIIAYITPIGWLIAYILNSSNKSKFATFHLRQALGLAIAEGVVMALSVFFILFIYLPFIFWPLRMVNIAILGLVVIGLVNANNGKAEPLPFIGEFLSKTFSGIN